MLMWAIYDQTCYGKYTDFIWGMASTCNKCWCFVVFFYGIMNYVSGRILYVPLIPKYVVFIVQPNYEYQHDYDIIPLIPKITVQLKGKLTISIFESRFWRREG